MPTTTDAPSIRQTSARLSQVLTEEHLQVLAETSQDEQKWRAAMADPEAFLRNNHITLPADTFISFEEKPVPPALKKIPGLVQGGVPPVPEKSSYAIPGLEKKNYEIPGLEKKDYEIPGLKKKLEVIKPTLHCVAVYSIMVDKYGNYYTVISSYICYVVKA